MLKTIPTLLLFVVSLAFGGILNNVVDDARIEKHWALIVAGSAGWGNFRHQADICHAYQIMRKNGIPAERIVTMMYDDLAQNTRNPTPGVLINHPNGSDVYAGVVIDYRRNDVTPKNFLSILQGDVDAMKGIGSGKVINSGPNDHVFVNFADHGAPGLIAFPVGVLRARSLAKAINNMNAQNKYKQMVVYIEACESGSMFKNLLPQNIGVFATTAANSQESSYACYFDKKYRTYLGDVYSVKWMEDSDKEDLQQESLQKQFQIVRTETKTSHVQEFGNMTISNEPVADFQGKAGRYQRPKPVHMPPAPLNAVASEEVPLAILRHRLETVTDLNEEIEIIDEIQLIIKNRAAIEKSMETIAKWSLGNKRLGDELLKKRHELTNFDCYEPLVDFYNAKCFDLNKNDFALRRLYVLVNLCEEKIPTEKIMKSIAKACFRKKKFSFTKIQRR